MKGCKSTVIKVMGVLAAALGLFFLVVIFSGDSDDAVETIKENRTKSIEEDEHKEAVRTPGSDDEIGSGSFYEYEVHPDSPDGYTVLVPEYVSDYVMEDLTVDEQERLLDSIHSYTAIKDVEELIETARPVNIPESTNVRDIARESYDIGQAFMFDINVGYISNEYNSFSGSIVGDDSIAGINMDTSFIDDLRLMQRDLYSTIALFAGLDNGQPVFIALNMELQ